MQKRRFEDLEGLRGVAAVVVVIYHFMLAFYLFTFFGPDNATAQHMRFEDNLYGNPLSALLSGTLAVAIFFVLSGFVLSIGFFQTQKLEIVKKLAAKRYLRLMLPALASTIICFVIISFGVSKINEVGAITQSSWLLSNWQINPTLFEAIKSGMYDIFVVRGSVYNNVLWTMVIEFAGSFLVFGFLALCGKLKYRWIGYAFLFIVTFNTWFFAFIAGMAIADLYAKGTFTTKHRSLLLIVPMVALGIFFGGYPVRGAEGTIFYGFLSNISSSIDWLVMSVSVGAIVLLFVILTTQQLSRFFSHRWLSILGKYTFALYLIHIPVIFTVSLTSFLIFYNTWGLSYNISVLVTFLVSAPVITGATILFERYVDAPSIRVSTKFANVFLGIEKPSPIFSNAFQRAKAVFKRKDIVPKQVEYSLEEAE